jgi:flagella basal body P-ring formation protein FlgA
MFAGLSKTNFFRSGVFCLLVWFLFWGSAPVVWSSPWEPRAVIKKYLKDCYPWPEIEILDISGDVSSPEPPEKIHLIQGPLGKSIFSLVFKSGERELVQANIRAMDWVVASRRPLKKNQIIEEEDVYLTLMDVRRMPKNALNRLESAWGKILTQSLGANMPIAENYMGDIPLIKKGQTITLVASIPGLKITTLGEARQDGYPGRSLKVVNLSSKRNVRGIPLDENHVSVEF